MHDTPQQIPLAPPQPAVSLDTDLNALRTLLSDKLGRFREAIAAAVLQLEGESADLANRLDGLSVNDELQSQQLGEELKAAVNFTDRAKGFFDPWRELFYDPYKAVLDCQKAVLGTVEGSVKTAKARLLTWEQEETDRRKLAAAILQAEQNKAEETRKLELAIDAETYGMNAEAVETLLEAPSVMPSVTVAPIERSAGLSGRKNWKAEVRDLGKLVTHVATELAAGNKQPLVFLLANESKLNNEAKTYESALAIPGVQAVNKGSLAVRR